MTDSATISLMKSDGTVEPCLLTFKISHESVSMETESEALGRCVYVGNDAFHALELFRRKIEPEGWRTLCNGSRKDAYPSGMCRDMGRGFVLYPIPSSGPQDLKTFDSAPVELIGTVQEQLDNWNTWRATAKGGSPKQKASFWDWLRGKK